MSESELQDAAEDVSEDEPETSWSFSSSSSAKRRGVANDLIDSEVRELCRRWPAILEDNTIMRLAHGRYRINGREVVIRLVLAEGEKEDQEEDVGDGTHQSPPSGAQTGSGLTIDSDDLIVRDGPLLQPFLDYIFDTGRGEVYDLPQQEAALPGTPKQHSADHVELEYRDGLPYQPNDRLAAMKFAKFEASMRLIDVENQTAKLDGAEMEDLGQQPDSEQHHVPEVIPQELGLVRVMPTTSVSDSALRRRNGRRRHLYGEVILPGEANIPQFELDIDSEDGDTVLGTWTGQCQRRQISLG